MFATGVYLCLRGRTSFTGGIIPIHVIGVTTSKFTHPSSYLTNPENNGLQCITDKRNCCRVENDNIRIGEWYFPNGTAVPILSMATTFFRNRGDNDSTVNLNRISSSDVMSPTGNFCCQVPNSTDRNQTVCANISEFLTIILLVYPMVVASTVISHLFSNCDGQYCEQSSGHKHNCWRKFHS